MDHFPDDVLAVFQAGGWVMYLLLLLSVGSVAISFERTIFWLRTHNRDRLRRASLMASKLRSGDMAGARALAQADRSVFGRFTRLMLKEAKGSANGSVDEAAAHELVERVRPQIERFSVVLSTTITAAPMLGILGTVTGIIRSFNLLGGEQAVTDPSMVAGGIAEALYTTAFGLIVALVTLFPYAIFRSHADRALSRLEALAAAMDPQRNSGAAHEPPDQTTSPTHQSPADQH